MPLQNGIEPNSDSNPRAPKPTVERLSTYLQFLFTASSSGLVTFSSAHVEAATGISAAQFRKDLSYFGEFGKPGVGYIVQELQDRIARILQLHELQPVILIGLGNLGAALITYLGLAEQRFDLVAAFDNDTNKVGQTFNNIPTFHIDRLAEKCVELSPRIAILTVPGGVAQDTFNRVYDTGIRAFLNFAPAILRVPDGVSVRNVSFAKELAVLSYHVKTDYPV